MILKEKPSKMQITGIIVTLIGVTVTVFAVGASSLSIVGYACLFMAVISYALYSVFVEKAADYTGAEITYTMLIVGAIVFGVLAVCEALFKGNISDLIALPFKESAFTIAILYQGIGCSIAAFFYPILPSRRLVSTGHLPSSAYRLLCPLLQGHFC